MPDEQQVQTSSRPLSPRLTVYRWSIVMMASGAHRASGVLLVLFVPFYLWVLHGMTGSPEDFSHISDLLHSLPGRLMLWLVSVALVYHFCNGIRFLCLDAGWGESQPMMRGTAKLVIATAVLAAVAFGVLLW
jgi:succinate dehydrogenase / fumarate reductase cytochrome b subunit